VVWTVQARLADLARAASVVLTREWARWLLGEQIFPDLPGRPHAVRRRNTTGGADALCYDAERNPLAAGEFAALKENRRSRPGG
jgi:hypothetical protein